MALKYFKSRSLFSSKATIALESPTFEQTKWFPIWITNTQVVPLSLASKVTFFSWLSATKNACLIIW